MQSFRVLSFESVGELFTIPEVDETEEEHKGSKDERRDERKESREDKVKSLLGRRHGYGDQDPDAVDFFLEHARTSSINSRRRIVKEFNVELNTLLELLHGECLEVQLKDLEIIMEMQLERILLTEVHPIANAPPSKRLVQVCFKKADHSVPHIAEIWSCAPSEAVHWGNAIKKQDVNL